METKRKPIQERAAKKLQAVTQILSSPKRGEYIIYDHIKETRCQ